MNAHNGDNVLRLFPGPAAPAALKGLYLDESLRPAGTPAQPFVYASFIASLDGRISLPDPETGTQKPPRSITNARDWRLFQELAASADVVVTSGRYMRDLAAGNAQDALPVSRKPEFADLLAWRREHGLAPQPAVAIVTRSLDVFLPDALVQSDRPIYVATGADADASRMREFAARGVRILKVGRGSRVEGAALVAALAREGFRSIDMVAGAVLLRMLLADGLVDRLYLTQACRVLAGQPFDTFCKGERLDPPVDFTLRSLCHDAGGDGVLEQLFAVLDRAG